MKSSKTDVIVLATAKAKPGQEAELERALRDVAGPTPQAARVRPVHPAPRGE
jgi:hypothetical protein